MHADVAAVLLAFAVMLAAAKLGGDLAVRAGQAAVLGELAAGIVLGNVHLLHLHVFDGWRDDAWIELLAQLGVAVLLFQVGLGCTVRDMLKVGLSALLVALLGDAASLGLGWLAAAGLEPGRATIVHVFLGATLAATSVAITARVFADLERTKTREARTVLGAAVVDDVLGLTLLATLVAAAKARAAGAHLSLGPILWIVAKAVAFLVGSVAIGLWASPRLFRLASRLKARGVLLATGLAFCFGLAWLGDAMGLAPIVGAFAAGLILEDVHFKEFTARGERGLSAELQPIVGVLAPIFFVRMGMRTDLAALAHGGAILLALALTAAAIAGKLACAGGVVEKGADRLSIAIGMIPRGEVTLLFADAGARIVAGGRPLLDETSVSAIVIVVLLSTLATPPALSWSLRGRGAASS